VVKQVTAAIIVQQGKILLARRQKGDALAGQWEFPGGKIEPGETPEQCLAREIMEEFGVTVEIQEFFAASTYRYQHIAIELLAYHTTYISGTFQTFVHTELAWVAPEQLMSYNLSAADIPIAEKLCALP
jgi:ADP-ribose pyrophosphatase